MSNSLLMPKSQFIIPASLCRAVALPFESGDLRSKALSPYSTAPLRLPRCTTIFSLRSRACTTCMSPHGIELLGDAQVTGDIAKRESEVNSVLKALRSNGLNIVAIHHHMPDTQPNVTFLRYWGRGPSAKLAAGFCSALNVLGK